MQWERRAMGRHEDIFWTLLVFKKQGAVGLNERSPKLAYLQEAVFL